MVRTAVHRESIEAPCSPPAAGPRSGIYRASCSIFKHGTQTQTGAYQKFALALPRLEASLPIWHWLENKQLLLSRHDRGGAVKEVTL